MSGRIDPPGRRTSLFVAEEKRRVIPIIEELAGETLLSIDTSKAEVAAAALDARRENRE